jgi:hypothetical protein
MEILKTGVRWIESSKKGYEPTLVTWWVSKPTESAPGHSNRPRDHYRDHRASFDSQSWTPFPAVSDDCNFVWKSRNNLLKKLIPQSLVATASLVLPETLRATIPDEFVRLLQTAKPLSVS